MEERTQEKSKYPDLSESIAVIVFFTVLIATIYMLLHSMTGQKLLQHACYDSYTRQALAWREGLTYLPDGEILTWLELAIYKGKYFVSFPPVPSLVMLPLTFHFDIETPNTLVCWIYAYLSFLIAYFIFRKRCAKKPWRSAFYAFYFVFGCNLLALSFGGWVWFQAQTLGFLLVTATIYCIMGKTKHEHMIAYFLWALSVGCRPFHALYLPYLLYSSYKNLGMNKETSTKKTITSFAIILIPAVMVAVTMMAYNYIRFDNPLEFGHNFLPAHTRCEQGQFSLYYILENYYKLFRLPWIQDGLLHFYKHEGSNFIITNPIYILIIFAMIKYRKNMMAWLLFDLILLNGLLLLTHKCMGALQFGLRYFVDMVPWILALLLLNRKVKDRLYISLIGIFGVAINVYGAWWFWIYNGGT